MNIIIDQGNTAVKIAQFDDKKLIEKIYFKRTDLNLVKHWINANVQKTDRIIVSSVTNDELEIDNENIIHLTSSTPLPIKIDYTTPETLGKDRIANAVAIWTLNQHHFSLAIDLGTCIKYDLVSGEGVYLGGNISPGMEMRYKALAHYTDKLPEVIPQSYQTKYGIDTTTSIVHGVQEAIQHEINGFIKRYTNEFIDLTIFMTGGDLNYFDKVYKNSIFANSDLTVVGLNEILIYNA